MIEAYKRVFATMDLSDPTRTFYFEEDGDIGIEIQMDYKLFVVYRFKGQDQITPSQTAIPRLFMHILDQEDLDFLIWDDLDDVQWSMKFGVHANPWEGNEQTPAEIRKIIVEMGMTPDDWCIWGMLELIDRMS